jgi:hypothetical protein
MIAWTVSPRFPVNESDPFVNPGSFFASPIGSKVKVTVVPAFNNHSIFTSVEEIT